MNDQSSSPTSRDFADALAATSVVVTVSMSAWHPNKTDRSLAGNVADANNARSGAFSVRKSLLDGADRPFKLIASLQQNLRAWINSQTVPFGVTTTSRTQGARLLANHLILPFTEHIEAQRAAMNELVTQACAAYELAKETAKLNLGDTYKESDYPDVASLARMFSLQMEITPVPDARAFQRIAGTGIASLHDSLAARLDDSLAEKAAVARADLEERAAAALTRITERLSALKSWLDAGADESGQRKPAIYQSMHDEARQIADTIDTYAGAIGLSPVMQNASLALSAIGAMTPEAVAQSEKSLDDALAKAREAYSCF